MKTKNCLYILLFLAFITIPASYSQVANHPTRKAETIVYICTGKSSERYHKTDRCRGLSACKAEVRIISLTDAKGMGRTPCKICYR